MSPEMNLDSVRGAYRANRSLFIAQTGIIAALYAGFTLICMLYLGSLAWGPVQFRLSEALVVLALLTPAAVPGLTLGCVLANLIAIPLMGSGILGMLDVVFGSTATLIGVLAMRALADKNVLLALLGPVVANALIVPAYLPIILQGIGFYTIPFTDIALDGVYIYMYLFGVASVGLGEAVVVYLLGLVLYRALVKSNVLSLARSSR